ncbi:hypothetical protein [Vibrio rarus]|uniref:hypothetical protein n=1 Tax=Vibrio rarus TaxID=413403 RepID=UPI0021C31883|nr:hypothetical protein [Vibrio rarus]
MKLVKDIVGCSLIGTVTILAYGRYWDWVVVVHGVSGIILTFFSALIIAFILKTSAGFTQLSNQLCLAQQSLPSMKRFFSAWFIWFGSKIVAMGAILFLFGEYVQFHGPLVGIVAFFLTVLSIATFEWVLLQAPRSKQRNTPLNTSHTK